MMSFHEFKGGTCLFLNSINMEKGKPLRVLELLISTNLFDVKLTKVLYLL